MATAEQVAGVDVPRVTEWLRSHEPEVRPPLSFARIAGGRSNLTYRVEDATGRRWVLRRPPLGPLLPSAHDMAREYRVIAALASSPVPVPPAVGLCVDETINGCPFYMMRFVDGVVLQNTAAANLVTEDVRRTASESLVDVLAALHAVDPDAVDLGDLGRREGYVERVLRRWHKQWEASKSRDLPAVAEVADRLARRIPPGGPARIVHGDFGLHNTLVAPDSGAVQAVLDWELCTLGDPLADLGWLLVTWAEPTDSFAPIPDAATLVPGFRTRTELVARYASRSPLDVSEIDFYMALAYWKLAVVLEGVYARHASGAYGETDDSWRAFDSLVPKLADAAYEATVRAGR